MKQAALFNLMGAGLIVISVILHIICLATPYYSGANMNDAAKKMQQLQQQMAAKMSSQQGAQGQGQDLSSDVGSMADSMMGSLNDNLPTGDSNSDTDSMPGFPSDSNSEFNPDFPGTGDVSADMQPVDEEHMSSSEGMQMGPMSGNVNFGLWKLCVHVPNMMSMCMDWGSQFATDPDSGMVTSFKASGWIHAVQAMAIIGAIASGLGCGLAIMNLVTESKGDRLRFMYLIIAGSCVAGGVFTLIGDMIMAAKYTSIVDEMIAMDPDPDTTVPPEYVSFIKDLFYLSWGFALDIVSVALAFLGGLAHIVGGHAARNSNGVV